MAPTKVDIGKTVLIILVLYIILPTGDVYTDLRLIMELYKGVPECNRGTKGFIRDSDEYYRCKEAGADKYCIDGEVINTEVCEVNSDQGTDEFRRSVLQYYSCRNHTIWSSDYKDYQQCKGRFQLMDLSIKVRRGSPKSIKVQNKIGQKKFSVQFLMD